MNKTNSITKGRRKMMMSMIILILFATVCIGFVAMQLWEKNESRALDTSELLMENEQEEVNKREAELFKIITLTGVLCLIFAFGYCLPRFIQLGRGNLGIYDEETMRRVLGRYVPAGESLVAGVCAMAHNVDMKYIVRNCVYKDGKLLPSENTAAIKLHKFTTSKFGMEMYIGVTEKHLLFCECEPCQYYYMSETLPAFGNIIGEEILYPIETKEIGHCLVLEDIAGGTIKPGKGGSMVYSLAFLNGSKLEFVVNKATPIEMPRHQEYQRMIIEALYNRKQ